MPLLLSKCLLEQLRPPPALAEPRGAGRPLSTPSCPRRWPFTSRIRRTILAANVEQQVKSGYDYTLVHKRFFLLPLIAHVNCMQLALLLCTALLCPVLLCNSGTLFSQLLSGIPL